MSNPDIIEVTHGFYFTNNIIITYLHTHGLKTVLDEMTDRLNDYTSFAGAPDDAESSVKFVYKTAETAASVDVAAAETETVKEGNIFTRLWQRIVNLFKF